MRESVISLNFGDSGLMLHGLRPVRSRQLKARIFEVPGSGGFLMTEGGGNLDEFYEPGQEVVVFEGIDDLTEKVRHYLACPEERDGIAQAGFLKTQQEHTYEKRFQELLAVGGELKARVRSGAPPIGPMGLDSARFSRIQARHRPTGLLKFLRKVLQAPCILLWGRHRGPRVARRLLYEISWRIAGEKTFSASGWPGRIFYRES
jgi:spore maturation protein CgeB